jgi:hypothetical protein
MLARRMTRTSILLIHIPISIPITRTCVRQLNHQEITLLSLCPSYLDHKDPCTFVSLRNQGEDRKRKIFEYTGFGLQKNTNLCRLPRSHTSSDWNVQALHRKLISLLSYGSEIVVISVLRLS